MIMLECDNNPAWKILLLWLLCHFTEGQTEVQRIRQQLKFALFWTKEEASYSDVLLHRGSKRFSVRKPSYIVKDIKIRMVLQNSGNKYSGFGFRSTKERG